MNGYKYRHELIVFPKFETVQKAMDAMEWCGEHFGEPSTERWGQFADGFNFNNEQDYIWFLLRWS